MIPRIILNRPRNGTPFLAVSEAIALLNQHGFIVTVATNQSGLARGYYDVAMLESIHQKMHAALSSVGGKIDRVFYCSHGPDENCLCRKPKPGLLHQISKTYDVSLENVPFVGDSMRDIEAAELAGAKPVLVLSGNGAKTLEKYRDKIKNIPSYVDLMAFAKVSVRSSL